MPDVGVLNLQIRDDSNEAASGLDQLVSKLRSLGKIASTKNEGIGNVAQHIRDIVDAVKFDNSKVETSLKNISTFMNSLSGLTKLNSINKLNVKPIEQLKTAIGEGFNIGQAGTQINRLREAISGEWNVENARNARDSMKLIASGIHELEKAGSAKSIDAIASSLEKYNGMMNSMMPVKQDEPFMKASKAVRSGVVDYTKAVDEYGDAMERTKLTFKEPMGLDLQQFSYKKGMVSEGQIKMDLDALGKWGDGFTEVKQTIENASEPVKTFNDTISETSTAAKSAGINEFIVDPITQLMERFTNCTAASETFGRSFNASAYSTQLMGADAIIAARNIEMLIDRLNTPIKYKGLNEVVNQLTGVKKNFLSAKESATAFANVPLEGVNESLSTTENIVRNIVANGTDITNAAEACRDIVSTVGGGETKLDFSVFDPSKLPLDALGMKLTDSAKDWYQYGETAKETFETLKNAGVLDRVTGSVREVGESVNAIIPYNENLENSWERIVARIDEANERAREASEIRALQEKAFYSGDGPKDMEYTSKFAETLTELDLLKAKLREAQIEFNRLFNMEGPGSSKTIKKGLEIDTLQEKIGKYIDELEEAKRVAFGTDISPKFTLAETSEMAQGVTELDLYRAKFADAQEAYNRLVNEFGADDTRALQAAVSLQNVSRKVEELEASCRYGHGALRDLLASMEDTILGAEGLRGAFKRMFPMLSGMLSRFKNIAKYRFLRTVLKQITSGAKEGLENVYRYSQIVGTSFAPSMDSAASALAQMRNSVGAALAPALQAIIPILNSIVSAFINVINVANQFFALLSGHASWTRAIAQTTTAYDDLKKSAKGAGGAAKELLADWDELNIIQGNGGGGGSGKEIPDYANMFEEVFDYDEKIKSVVDTINNGFGDMWGFVKEIGLGILAWKVSRAFKGFVGKLASIVAGGVLLDIGLKFSYGGGYSAGTKGFFDGFDFVQVVGGIIASGLGGSLITAGIGLGGGVGFGVGITVAIVATLAGYVVGQQDMKDKAKWGNISLSAKEIREAVEKQFNFDVVADIEVLHANVRKLDNARREATTKINEFKRTLRNTEVKLTLGMDASAEGANVSGAVRQALEAIGAVKQQITETETAIEVAMKIVPYENQTGEDVSDDILKSIKVADKTLFEYMTGLGKKLSDALYEGEISGWKNGTTEVAIELMRAQEEIYNEAERIKKQRELDSTMKELFSGVEVKDGIIDRDSAMQVFDEQKKLLDEYKEAAVEEARAEADSLNWLGDLAQSAANYELSTGDKNGLYEGLQKAADDLYSAADLRLSEIEEQTGRKLEETREAMRTQWTELFKEVYGEDFEEGLLSFLATNGTKNEFDKSVLDWFGEIFGVNNGDFNHKIGKLLTKGYSPKEIADQIRNDLKIGNDGSVLYNPYSSFLPEGSKEILEYFGIDAFDIYAGKAKQEIMDALIEAIGGANPGDADKRFAAEIFKSLFKIDSWDEIEKYMPNGKIPEIEASFGFKPSVKNKPMDGEELDIWDVNDSIPNPYAKDNGASLLPEVEVPAPITFNTDGLEDALLEAYSSNGLTTAEIEDIIGEYKIPVGDIIKFVNGSEIFDDDYVRNEIIDALEKSGSANIDPNAMAKKFVRSGQIIGSAGMSDVGYGAYRPSEGTTRDENKQDIASGVASGTADLASTLNAILQVAQAINRKDFSVTISPNSAFGRGVTAGLGALANVTGNNP